MNDLVSPVPRGWVQPSAAISAKVREHLQTMGERFCADHFGLRASTLARAGCGLPVQAASLRVIQQALSTPMHEGGQ
jgi:hypothetical protein